MAREPARKLVIEQLELPVDAAQFGFSVTDELQPLEEIVGQPRAMRALDLGLGITHPGYNIYVAGMSGMGKKGMIHQALTERVGRGPSPPDWLYVNQFDDPDRPIAISLPAGQAVQLKRDMEQLVEQLREELPKAFRRRDLHREEQQLSGRFQQESRRRSQQPAGRRGPAAATDRQHAGHGARRRRAPLSGIRSQCGGRQ